jgi:lauroyl/myristoyl acyltransferase
MIASNLLVAMAWPIQLLDGHMQTLDRYLDISLSQHEVEAIRNACSRSNVRLGAYYHWYLQKMIMARRFRSLDKSHVLSRLNGLDRTDYSTLDNIPDDGRGLLVAIPHFGHYVLSIIGLVETLRSKRNVLVFYGAPATHAGNDLFDRLHMCLYGDEQSNVSVIHDTRAGMAMAIRGLEDGAAVIIMPDVFKNERDTYLIPFCGRPLNVMLGTAALARKTLSRVLPAVSMPSRTSLRFNTVFSSMLDAALPLATSAPSPPNNDFVHLDYRSTLSLFMRYEEVIAEKIMYWQYSRTHYGRTMDFPYLDKERILKVSELFFNDPRANLGADRVICID